MEPTRWSPSTIARIVVQALAGAFHDRQPSGGGQMNYVPKITETTVRTGTIQVEGLNIFYREAGKPGNP